MAPLASLCSQPLGIGFGGPAWPLGVGSKPATRPPHPSSGAPDPTPGELRGPRPTTCPARAGAGPVAPHPMLQTYAPILILAVLVAGFALASLVLSDLLGKKRRSIGKADAYESGMDPRGSARLRLSIHFYLVAVLFILFDVESIFLIPWAATVRGLSAQGLGPVMFFEVLAFVGVLALGLAYVWRKGGLEWDR